MTISSRLSDMTRQARPSALFAAEPTPSPSDRHWFVPDDLDGFYCAACGLPRLNRRHCERRATA